MPGGPQDAATGVLTAPADAAAGSRLPSSEQGIKLRRLTIRNYKAIDELTLDFPAPLMPGDPDIIVLGSSNGVGKTTVLEACALLCLAGRHAGLLRSMMTKPEKAALSLPDLLIRAGADELMVEGSFEADGTEADVSFALPRDGASVGFFDLDPLGASAVSADWTMPTSPEEMIVSFLGLAPDPLLAPPAFYFHSYRRVNHGAVDTAALLNGQQHPNWRRYWGGPPTSLFKTEVLRSVLAKHGVYENVPGDQADEVLGIANRLIERYAAGRVDRLHLLPNNGNELRVSPTADGAAFPFDGLSSGQKEIISTLFLIWLYTREQPGIVLIDEPELHLNAEWHRAFVRSLHELAPRNQYILATHSEHVFRSVDQDRRILLVPSGDPHA